MSILTKSQIEKCKQIAKYYGESNQLSIMCEEAAELIQAIIKNNREAPDADKRLTDGLADVAIMLTQLLSFYDDDERTAFIKLVNFKLDQQLEIIKAKEM